MRISPLALAAGLLASTGAALGDDAVTGPSLEPSVALLPSPAGAAGRLPIVLQAQTLRSQPDLETVAEGQVVLRRGDLQIDADRLAYDAPSDLASARGHVRVQTPGAVYSGPELELKLQRFQGHFLEPEFEFLRLGAGGRADRIDFLDSARSRATQASYTSCPRDGPAEPDWVLRTRSVSFDLDTNVGVAEGAVLRFLGTPILAMPSLSFPLNDARKSGWLPPSINIDNRNGVELLVPYYWNIAPNRDATIAPRVITRRGIGLNTEIRYLEPDFEGSAELEWLPNDRLAGRSRESLQWQHSGQLGGGVRYQGDWVHVSDQDWWKDFPNASRALTARLLPLHLALERPFELSGAPGLLYARATQWQVLQATDSFIVSPYERSPQLGAQWGGRLAGWEFAVEGEFNRFTLPQGQEASTLRAVGDRLHLLGSLSLPFREAGWWVVPRAAFNAAGYRYSAAAAAPGTQTQAGRTIPSFSIDAGFELERDTRAFGRALHQTLEPRLLYVITPFRAQSQLPNFDAAAKDFNFASIYTDNAFSGVDRVSDAHQLTAGVTTRLVDAVSGAEAFRLGLAQRYLLSTQRVTAQADGTPDGEPLTQRLSDVLLLGSTSVLPAWNLDASVQYSPEISRSVRSIIGARYSPGPFRTVGATYRYSRGLSEQLETAWQWPLAGSSAATPAAAGSRGCSGAWYSVGRVNYSLKDRRVTDSVLGLEFDAGCWIARVVAMRLSTGLSEATTRLAFQLELTGLSKLNVGSNPLQVLKDNIPGYRLLRDEPAGAASTYEDRPSPAHE